jgi:hypothetical protein
MAEAPLFGLVLFGEKDELQQFFKSPNDITGGEGFEQEGFNAHFLRFLSFEFDRVSGTENNGQLRSWQNRTPSVIFSAISANRCLSPSTSGRPSHTDSFYG